MTVDHGFTHVALQVSDLDRSIEFYGRYADMVPVHRRTGEDGVRVAWIGDLTRPFVVVLIETPDGITHPLAGWNHLGIGVDSAAEVDRRLALAADDGRTVAGPYDSGPPVGYFGLIVDPDGHNLEVAYGQEVAFTVEHPEPTTPSGGDGTTGGAASS